MTHSLTATIYFNFNFKPGNNNSDFLSLFRVIRNTLYYILNSFLVTVTIIIIVIM
jgi:hypothetical protein